MKKYGVENKPAKVLSTNEELELTKIISNIILDNNYQCFCYNICVDHVHLLIRCEPSNLSEIVKRIKSFSSRLFNPGEKLWSQKFYKTEIENFDFRSPINFPSYAEPNDHLANAVFYIQNNRAKHNLKRNKELEEIINSFCQYKTVD